MGNCFLSKIGSTVPTIKIDVLRATTSASTYTIVTQKEYDVLFKLHLLLLLYVSLNLSIYIISSF